MTDIFSIDIINNIEILLIIILFFFCLYLLRKVKKQKNEIENLKLESNSFITNSDNYLEEDIVSMKNISKVENDVTTEEKNNTSEIPKTKNTNNIKKDDNKTKRNNVKEKFELYQNEYQISKNKNNAYTKNVLHNAPRTTSPLVLNNDELNLNEFVKHNKKKKKEDNYLEEVSKEIAKEIKSSTIELTDYEKEEEENAIISYQELLNCKNKDNQNNGVDTGEFIEELKKFRNSLN